MDEEYRSVLQPAQPDDTAPRLFSRNRDADNTYWEGVAELPSLLEEVIGDTMYDGGS